MPTLIITVKIYKKASFDKTHSIHRFLVQDRRATIGRRLVLSLLKNLIDIFRNFNKAIGEEISNKGHSDERARTRNDSCGISGKPDP